MSRFSGNAVYRDYDWLYRHYVELGLSQKEIAQIVGCKPATINYYIWTYGLKELRVTPLYSSKEYLYQKYIVDGLSVAEIARELGCSHDTVTYWLKKYGLKKPVKHIKGCCKACDYNLLYDLYVNKGLSISKISKILGVRRRIVSSRLEEFGINKRPLSHVQLLVNGKNPEELPIYDYEWLRHHYVELRLSKKDIAAMFGIDPGTVHKALRDFGIRVRGNSEAKLDPNKPRDIENMLRNWSVANQRPVVLERDNYTCKLCGSRKKLQVHHIVPFQTIIQLCIEKYGRLFNLEADEGKIAFVQYVIKNDRLFNSLDNLETQCFNCHRHKTHKQDPTQSAGKPYSSKEASETIESIAL